jgi:hypothetical protein
MTDGIFQDIAEYIRVSKDSLNLLRAAWNLLPKGEKRDEAEQKIKAADEALKRTDAALALKFGYHLCQCTFPPQIMLWREKERGHFCPKCSHNTASFNRDFKRSTPEYF